MLGLLLIDWRKTVQDSLEIKSWMTDNLLILFNILYVFFNNNKIEMNVQAFNLHSGL